VSFSSGITLQALETWKVQGNYVAVAPKALLKRCPLTSLTREGSYAQAMELTA
jgi:hypothetical protein